MSRATETIDRTKCDLCGKVTAEKPAATASTEESSPDERVHVRFVGGLNVRDLFVVIHDAREVRTSNDDCMHRNALDVCKVCLAEVGRQLVGANSIRPPLRTPRDEDKLPVTLNDWERLWADFDLNRGCPPSPLAQAARNLKRSQLREQATKLCGNSTIHEVSPGVFAGFGVCKLPHGHLPPCDCAVGGKCSCMQAKELNEREATRSEMNEREATRSEIEETTKP